MISLFEQLRKYGDSTFYPYHMPGHKRNVFGDIPNEIVKMDITEIEGFDNLHQPEGILKELQEQAAQLFGAEESFYLVNGSTSGILSAVSAAVPQGGHILMTRGSHRSAYHAAYLRNLKISYLYPPEMEGAFDICDAITPDRVEAALEKEQDIDAVFLVSPTYEGRIADVRSIAQIVHKRNIPLVVDEAHGAHLGMADGFAENSCRAGADLVIHSVHKTLPAMTQTALLHVNGQRINRGKLKRFLHIYQTSSPSYLLMASIDNAIRVISEDGREMFARFRANYEKMTESLSVCRCLRFLPLENGKQDIGKLVISGIAYGMDGRKIYDLLLRDYHLQTEMASAGYCLAMFTVGDKEEAYIRMKEALMEIDDRAASGELAADRCLYEGNGKSVVRFLAERQDMGIPFAKAWDQEKQMILLNNAAGHYAGEFINLYPPGIPLLVPGEKISDGHCRRIMTYLEQGLNVQGVSIKKPYQVCVLRDHWN